MRMNRMALLGAAALCCMMNDESGENLPAGGSGSTEPTPEPAGEEQNDTGTDNDSTDQDDAGEADDSADESDD